MKNKEEKILNRFYQQLTEIYYLKGVCLEILKDLEEKKELSDKEQYWKSELLSVVFSKDTI